VTVVADFIYSRLINDAAVSAIISTRAYYVKMPDNPVLPAVTFQVTSGAHEENFLGSSRLRSPVVSIDSWATTARASAVLAEAVRRALHGYRGAFETLVVQNCLEWSEYDLYDPDVEIYHVAASCRLWYYDTV
jgi:hypothetical protein